jgi:trans-aconitate 2-methyltransferase
MSWSPQQYLKFENERNRPILDLLNAVPTAPVRRAVDIGCGPGNSTELLAARFPDAQISGFDNSPEMIASARKRLPQIAFEVADATHWQAPQAMDVMLSNAVFQWVPDHAAIMVRLVAQLAPGGSLAVQMPDNLEEPAHRLMREVAGDARWAGKLAKSAEQRDRLGSADFYYGLLKPKCQRVEIWRTTYFHTMASADGIVEWFKGTGLRPFLTPLAPDEQAAELARYREEVARAYPPTSEGTVLLPFPRLFIVATR